VATAPRDHPIYPDCRPAFVEAIEHEARIGNEGFIADGFRVLAPFLAVGKDEIVRRGAAVAVPFAETWSCYVGGERHCGRCGTCVERRGLRPGRVNHRLRYAEASGGASPSPRFSASHQLTAVPETTAPRLNTTTRSRSSVLPTTSTNGHGADYFDLDR
jgi:hypothetical protein